MPVQFLKDPAPFYAKKGPGCKKINESIRLSMKSQLLHFKGNQEILLKPIRTIHSLREKRKGLKQEGRKMEQKKKSTNLYEWILRIGIAGTFFGHGFLAIGVKPNWVPLLTVYGFSTETAVQLMPVIGTLDIVISVMVLIYPMRILLMWAGIWAFTAALSRPIAGEPVAEFIERSANWAVPFALLLLQGFPKNMKGLFTTHD